MCSLTYICTFISQQRICSITRKDHNPTLGRIFYCVILIYIGCNNLEIYVKNLTLTVIQRTIMTANSYKPYFCYFTKR